MGIKGESGRPVMRIVCDTGPILHLREAGLLDLLHDIGTVHIPPSVNTELLNLLQWNQSMPSWITIEQITPSEHERAEALAMSGVLDYAEATAVLISQRLCAKWFVTDDSAARIFAESLGLEVHGSLGIVLWTAAAGHLKYDEAQDALSGLIESSLWISPGVRMAAVAALKKMFDRS